MIPPVSKLAPLRLRCIEFTEYLKGGVTRPMLVAAEDETGKVHSVVLKVRQPESRNGHYEGTSLACELICSVIARAVGLPVPDYAVVEIPRSLPPNTLAESARSILQKNIGSNFGSIYREGLMKWCELDSKPKNEEIVAEFENILSFDAAVMNQDRTITNSNLLIRGNSQFLLIDHSLALTVHSWPDSKICASPVYEDSYIQKHCGFPILQGQKRDFSELFNRWIDKASDADFLELRSFIPPSWEKNKGDIDRIFRFLKGRKNRFDDLSNCLRRELR